MSLNVFCRYSLIVSSSSGSASLAHSHCATFIEDGLVLSLLGGSGSLHRACFGSTLFIALIHSIISSTCPKTDDLVN